MQEDFRHNKLVSFLIRHMFDILFAIPSIIPVISWIRCLVCKTYFTDLEVLLSIIIVVYTIIWMLIARNYYGYPTACRKSLYKTRSKVINYQRRKDYSLCVSRAIEVESNVNGLDRIKDRYLWTGKSDAGMPRKGKNVISIHEEESIGIWKYFSVNFNQILSKGDKMCVSYKWPRLEHCESSSPFVSTDTEYETDHIVFNINLGKEYANHELILESFRSIESECPISSKSTHFDDEGCFSWEIPKPRRYRYFRARWNWALSEQDDDES